MFGVVLSESFQPDVPALPAGLEVWAYATEEVAIFSPVVVLHALLATGVDVHLIVLLSVLARAASVFVVHFSHSVGCGI